MEYPLKSTLSPYFMSDSNDIASIVSSTIESCSGNRGKRNCEAFSRRRRQALKVEVLQQLNNGLAALKGGRSVWDLASNVEVVTSS
jgi:hypothetical protein